MMTEKFQENGNQTFLGFYPTRFQMKIKFVLFSLFFLFSNYLFLESSLINPDLAPQLSGYEDFAKGRSFFNQKDLDEAAVYFSKAIKKCQKPSFKCFNYIAIDGYGSACHEFDEDEQGYVIREIDEERTFAIYRHSHFYLGLIRLHQREFKKASLHFKKAIGFNGYENNLGLQFYKCANIIHPSWIVLASLTCLHEGKFDESKELMNMAFWTLENTEFILDKDFWSHMPQYWSNLKERGITTEKWNETQLIILYNTKSVIADAQNNIEEAIDLANKAIHCKDLAIKKNIFQKESKEDFVLYNNRGVLFSRNGNYHEAIIDFTKSIELNSTDAGNYFHRGNHYLFLEDYSKALYDYDEAIKFDQSNPEYYYQRALAHTIMGSHDEAKLDLELAEIKKNDFDKIQNELGLNDFSKGSFQKAIIHFNQFIKFNPHLSVGYQNRGSAFFQAGMLKNAIEDYDEAIRLDPTQADLYQMRGIALMTLPPADEIEENSNLIEAQSNLLVALKINPINIMLYQNLATCHYLKDDLDTALEYYEKAIAFSTHQDHGRLFKDLGFIQYEQAKYDEAILNCKKAIQSGNIDGSIFFLQGLCHFEINQFEQAIHNYDLAVEAFYDVPDVYFNRAKTHFYLHHFDKALDDTNIVLKIDPANAECYKLRGVIYLSMHKEAEAYADFGMALNIDLSDLNFNDNKNYTSNSKLTFNSEERLFQFNDILTSLNDRFCYKPLLQSKLILNDQPLLAKFSQISLDSFGKGLILGLMAGGIEGLNELGPFLANLLFHPVETTKELLTAIQHLLLKSLKEEWEAVFGALAPELKELFSTWDEIEDFHKGKLTGLFIGKNGVTVLTAIGAVKALSKLKKVVICSKKKSHHLLKKTKPEVSPLPASEFPVMTVLEDKGWHLPYDGGAIIGERYYTEHALGRIAPNTFQNNAILEARAIKKTQELGLPFTTWDEVKKWTLTDKGKSFSIDLRGIPPSVIEAEIANPGTTGIKVILNEKGDVVTVLHQKNNLHINGE